VKVNFFSTVTLIFQAALNSDGVINLIPNIVVEQRDRNGISVMNHSATVQDNRNSQIFSVTFQQVGGNLAGTYSACKCHEYAVKLNYVYFAYSYSTISQ